MEQVNINQIGPNIKVKNFAESKKFYDSFGFKKIVEFGPDCQQQAPLRGIIYYVGNALLEIGEGHMAVKPHVFEQEITSSKVSLMVNVDSLVPVLDVCRENGFEIAVQPRKFPWGQIGVVVTDPDGFILVFLSPVTDDEIQQVQALSSLPLEREEPDYTADNLQAIQAR